MSAHDFTFTSITGEEMPLSNYKGKTLLVVNTASECGFTKQYDDMQALYEAYEGKDFVLIGVPSNDFGGQEPGSEEEIKKFCETNFNITFPMTSKNKVVGKEAHPFYQWANKEAGMLGSPKWNFHKFLIGPEGQFINWYASTTNPTSDKIKKAIDQSLSN
jgi:Glutathione peroxidase